MPENGWKFGHLRDGRFVSAHGDLIWTVGEWAPTIARPQLCQRGYHDSLTIPDALRNVRGDALALTEVRGAAHLDAENHPDKRCHAEMRLLRVYRWTKRDSVALAVFAAELVLSVYEDRYPDDDRPRKAIAAAKAYLSGEGSATYAAYAAYAAATAATADADDAAAYAAYAAAAAAYAAYAAAAAANDADAAVQRAEHALPAVREQIAAWAEQHVAELEEITPQEAR